MCTLLKRTIEGVSNIVTFEITTELTGPVVESNQLIRLFDDVPRKALAQEVIGNRLVYGNYLRNYDVDPDITMTTALDTEAQAVTSNGNTSIKSNRTYQLGVSFIDEYNRESPVFTDENAALFIDATNGSTVNKLKVNVTSTAPSWATFYKYYVKEISTGYENLVLDRVYDAADGSVWLSFPSSERNKVSTGDFLSLKKKHDLDEAVNSITEYKVLDIQNEAPFYIVNTPVHKISTLGAVSSTNDFSVTIPEQKFFGPVNTSTDPNLGLAEALKQGNFIQFRQGNRRSARYEIFSGGTISGSLTTSIGSLGLFSEYSVILKNDTGLLLDDDWLTDSSLMSSGDNFEINVFSFEQNYKAEFQGKFFVKIPESNDISQHVKDTSQDVSYAKLYRTKLSDDIPASPNATVITGVQSTWFGGSQTVTEQQPRSRMAFSDTNTNPDTGGQHPTNSQKTFDIVYGPVGIEGVTDQKDNEKVFNKLAPGTKIRFAKDGNKSSIYTIITASKSSYSRSNYYI